MIVDSHISLGEELHLRCDASDAERQMVQHGVSLAVARPMGSELVSDNQAGNNRVLSASTRIRGLVSANPWMGPAALAELRRCQAKKPAGLYLHPSRQGFFPTESVAAPLIEFAADAGWPVVFHTGTYIYSDVLAVAAVARRYPHVPFVCDCAGFTDMWFELPSLMRDSENLYLCASLIWGRAVANAVKQHGSSRILFGSGMPRDSLKAALTRFKQLELNEADQQAIFAGNARRIFRLDD
jgi:hypothetical protein